ncbi:hypothetical protein HR45_10535 [Shewanella mangrovi]|uniref:AbiV family abortive infection protein n=1 Tax=Shewanella mangrovi TaxID=1515746 RepID=A0A094JC28_9GAMM|nr:hypothetical protein [Shewanella mangrovi]KFZ37445.1 hypothetical protein HR45_10535 [Shewanella mangrovi]
MSADEHLYELIHWINENSTGFKLPNDARSSLALGCLDVALEHQAAILLLYRAELYGSMSSILRVLFESLVRGVWLYKCASESDLRKFEKGIVEPKFFELIDAYENKIGDPDGVLSQFKKKVWKLLNDFTHTGFNQVCRRHSEGKLGSNYEQSELDSILKVSGALGLFAASQIAGIGDKSELTQAYIDKIKEYTAL